MKKVVVGLLDLRDVEKRYLSRAVSQDVGWDVEFLPGGGFTYRLPPGYTYKEWQIFREIWNNL